MMKYGCKHIIGLVVFLIGYNYLNAQVNLRANINRDNILIGEPIELTVEAYLPLGSKINWFNSDTIPHFEILATKPVDTIQNMDGKKISQSLTITSFDSGRILIPPFEVLVDEESYVTDSLSINVSFAPFDPNADYRDIKDIIEEINPSIQYIPWILGGLALLSLVALTLILGKKVDLVSAVKKPPDPGLTPYEEAIRALEELENRTFTEAEVKNYYSEMNDILRNYVAKRFGLATFERTNDELVLQLSHMSIPRDSFISLTQSLRMSDIVKFAKYNPSESDNKNNLKIVRSSIDILDKRLASAV